MNLEPLGHRVLIDPVVDGVEEITDGALAGFKFTGESVEQMRAATQRGRIVAIGKTAWEDAGLGGKRWAEVGDLIYFAKYAHKSVMDGDKEYFIVNDEDCQCKIKEDLPDFLEEEK